MTTRKPKFTPLTPNRKEAYKMYKFSDLPDYSKLQAEAEKEATEKEVYEAHIKETQEKQKEIFAKRIQKSFTPDLNTTPKTIDLKSRLSLGSRSSLGSSSSSLPVSSKLVVFK